MRHVSNHSKARVLNEFKEFKKILAERQKIESKDTPKKQETSPILETIAQSSPAPDVRELADLQLECDSRVAGLRIRLTTAHEKIQALQCAIAEQETHYNHLKTRVNALKGMDQTRSYESRLQTLLETLQNQESQVYLMSQQLAAALQQVQELTVKANNRTSQRR